MTERSLARRDMRRGAPSDCSDMDRPFAMRHNTITEHHIPDERAMKRRLRMVDDRTPTERRVRARRSAVRRRTMLLQDPDAKVDISNYRRLAGGRAAWNLSHTGCVHVGAVID